MNPRPLGYEPYDVCLCRLGLSLVTLLTSVDLLREVFSDFLRLPRLSLSRRVWFTNRFTEQAIDLHFSYLNHLPRVPSLGGTVSRVAKRLPTGPTSPLLRPYAP